MILLAGRVYENKNKFVKEYNEMAEVLTRLVNTKGELEKSLEDFNREYSDRIDEAKSILADSNTTWFDRQTTLHGLQMEVAEVRHMHSEITSVYVYVQREFYFISKFGDSIQKKLDKLDRLIDSAWYLIKKY